jgi:hypothetical protein
MSWLSPNINGRGRIVRGLAALALLAGGLLALRPHPLVGILLLSSALFVLFEALRGWCILRACGIKTRL